MSHLYTLNSQFCSSCVLKKWKSIKYFMEVRHKCEHKPEKECVYLCTVIWIERKRVKKTIEMNIEICFCSIKIN